MEKQGREMEKTQRVIDGTKGRAEVRDCELVDRENGKATYRIPPLFSK